jgi:hypothetical protein
MRALAVVPGIDRPRPLAIGRDWLVLPFVDGGALPDTAPVPDTVFEVLARVHAHWWRKRPRGLPVVDAGWWARLCDHVLVAVRGALARTGEPEFAEAERALVAWRADPRIRAALAVLPRTLVHGDPHRGNVLVDDAGAVLIDWGNARVAPAGLDLAVLGAQGASPPTVYDELFAELAGAGSRLREVEAAWADVQVNVQYLGFAADHLGAGRVHEMITTAGKALDALGAASRFTASSGKYQPHSRPHRT